MKKSVDFKTLEEQAPLLIMGMIDRAKEVKNQKFDGGTDPSSWNWIFEIIDYRPYPVINDCVSQDYLLTHNEIQSERNADDFRLASSTEDYVRSLIRDNLIKVNVVIDTGMSEIKKEIQVSYALPKFVQEHFDFKDFKPQEWDGDIINIYRNESHASNPGVTREAVLAAFHTTENNVVMLVKDFKDTHINKLYSLDETNNVATLVGELVNDNKWDVPKDTKWEDTGWRRLKDGEMPSFNTVFAEKIDFDSLYKFRNVGSSPKILLNIMDKTIDNSKNDFFNVNDLEVNPKLWEVGESVEEKTALENKWKIFDDKKSKKEIRIQGEVYGLGEGRPQTLSAAIVQGDNEAFNIIFKAMSEQENGFDWLLKKEEGDVSIATKLLWACAEKCDGTVFESLLSLGADKDYIQTSPDPEIKFSFINCSIPSNVVKSNNIQLMEHLIKNDFYNVEVSDGGAETLLMQALRQKQFEMADKLIELGADVDAVNFYSNSSLHIAASQGEFDTVKWLIENNADPTLINLRNNSIASELVPEDFDEIYEELEDYREAFEAGNGSSFTMSQVFLSHTTQPEVQSDDAQEENTQEEQNALDQRNDLLSSLEKIGAVKSRNPNP